MKFKQFLEEKYIKGPKEWKLMTTLAVPLSPSLLQELEKNIYKAYHVTDLAGFNTLVNLQGKRKDVACFTRGSEGISNGAKTQGTILVTLQGKSSFYSEKDFRSKLDRNGIRWIENYGDVGGYEEDKADSVIYNSFSKIMEKLILKKYKFIHTSEIFDEINNSNGKEKAVFVKWYYDESKKIISKYFIKNVENQLRKLQGHVIYDNNELFIHNIKILKTDIIDKYDEGEDEYQVEINKLEQYGFGNKLISKWDIEKIK